MLKYLERGEVSEEAALCVCPERGSPGLKELCCESCAHPCGLLVSVPNPGFPAAGREGGGVSWGHELALAVTDSWKVLSVASYPIPSYS